MTASTASDRPDLGSPVPRWLTITIGCLIVVGLTLWMRYRAIGVSSLWLDDAWVGVGAKFPTIGDTIRSGLTSPGFSLMYRAWATVFGDGAEAAQLLALTFAVAAPVVLFLAAIERGLPAYAALLGAGLLATAPGHIDMSGHLKQYTAEALAMTVVLWVAWRVLERPGAAGRWAALTAVAISASLLSTIGALVALAALAVCFLATLLARPRPLRPAIISGGVYAVFVLPWMLLAVQPNVHEKLSDYWRGYYLDGDGFAGGLGTRLGAVARAFQDAPSAIVLLILAVAAAIVLVRRPLIGLLLVFPTVMAVGLAAFSVVPLGTGETGFYRLLGRTDVYLLPTYALLVAVAVAEVARLVPARGRVAVGALALATFVAAVLIAPASRLSGYPEEDLTPLVHIVERDRKAGDAIVVYPSSGYAYGIATRYPIEKRSDALAPTDWVVKVRGPDVDVLQAHREDPEKWAGPLDDITADAPRVWLVGSHIFNSAFVRPDWHTLKDMIAARGYRAVRGVNRAGAQLALFVRVPTTSQGPSQG